MIIKRIIKDPKYDTNRVLQKIDLNYGIKISKPGEVWIKITER